MRIYIYIYILYIKYFDEKLKQILFCWFSETGDKTSGGSNSGIEVAGKGSSSSATTDAGKSKKGFSG